MSGLGSRRDLRPLQRNFSRRAAARAGLLQDATRANTNTAIFARQGTRDHAFANRQRFWTMGTPPVKTPTNRFADGAALAAAQQGRPSPVSRFDVRANGSIRMRDRASHRGNAAAYRRPVPKGPLVGFDRGFSSYEADTALALGRRQILIRPTASDE